MSAPVDSSVRVLSNHSTIEGIAKVLPRPGVLVTVNAGPRVECVAGELAETFADWRGCPLPLVLPDPHGLGVSQAIWKGQNHRFRFTWQGATYDARSAPVFLADGRVVGAVIGIERTEAAAPERRRRPQVAARPTRVPYLGIIAGCVTKETIGGRHAHA
jgi:hypothetical protein